MKGLWRCPLCGRLFEKPNQSHSHYTTSITSHFEGKPVAKELFDILLSKLETFGPLRVDAVKTSINLIAKHHFGAVHPGKKGLRLGFVLSRKVEDVRITHHEWVGGNRWGHRVSLTSLKDIDDQLLGWLKEPATLSLLRQHRNLNIFEDSQPRKNIHNLVGSGNSFLADLIRG